MKPFKGNWAEHGSFDEQINFSSKRTKKSKRPLNEDEENEFQSWMNRPSDVSDYLDNDEDLHSPPGRT